MSVTLISGEKKKWLHYQYILNDNFCAAKLAESVNNASTAFPSEYR